VTGNLLVQGDTIGRSTDQVEGNVTLGNEDIDTVTIEGTLQTGHSSGSLQITSPISCNNNVDVTANLSIGGLLQSTNISHTEQIANAYITINKLDSNIPIGGSADLGRIHRVPQLQYTLFSRPFQSLQIKFSPYGCAFDGRHLWVCDQEGGRVVKVDILNNTEVAEVTGLAGPSNIAYDGAHIWVTDKDRRCSF